MSAEPMVTPIKDPIWPGPRLIVPVTLDALVVGTPNQQGSWTAVRTDYAALPFGDPVPGPFGAAKAPDTGIHLSWTLPFALRRGVTRQDGVTEFPKIPDRWLVTRSFVKSPGKAPVFAAWILESDFIGTSAEGSIAYPDPRGGGKTVYIGRRIPLASWAATPSALPFLQAVGPGDVSFSAIYDNVRNVLSIHDALTDDPFGDYGYAVAGWYADSTLDPLFGRDRYGPSGFRDQDEWKALLDDLRFSVGTEADLEAARAAWAAWLADHPISGGPSIPAIMKDLPGQMLVVGELTGIAWKGPEQGYPIPKILETTTPPTVAVGETGGAAIAAYLAAVTGKPDTEDAVLALQLDQLFEAFRSDDRPDFAAVAHAASFTSRKAGPLSTVVPARSSQGEAPGGAAAVRLDPPQTAALTVLNDAELTLARAIDREGSLAFELLMTGWKQAHVDPRDKALKAQITAAVETLVGRVRQAKDESRAAETAREDARIALLALLGSDFELSAEEASPARNGTDPVILVAGAGLDTKLGPPDATGDDYLLFVRFTGQTITGLSVTFDAGGGPITERLDAGALPDVTWPGGVGIPMEMPDLWIESLFLDLSDATLLADTFFRLARVTPTPAQREALVRQIEKQQTLVWNVGAGIDRQTIAEIAGLEGTIPDKISVSRWTPPWTPLFLDWEVEWRPTSTDPRHALDDWSLGETDFRFDGTTVPKATRTLRGRSPIDAQLARGLADKIAGFLATSPYLDELPVFVVDDLDAARRAFATTDLVTQALTGFSRQLIDRKLAPNVDYPNQDQRIPELTKGIETALPMPGVTTATPEGFDPIRSGHFVILRLHIVDAYGQTLRAEGSGGAVLPIRSAGVTTPGGTPNAAFVQLAPRLSQAARLDFRLIDADDDTIRSNSSERTSPVAGWLIPNHLDDSLTIFSPDGTNLGSVIMIERDTGTGLRWDAVPGASSALGAPPAIPNRHVRSFVDELLVLGTEGTDALRDLLDVIDTTKWAKPPLGQPLPGNLDALIGTPVAVVRTALSLDLAGEPACDQAWLATGKNETHGFERTRFPVRIGDLVFAQNGVLGYFLDDDYAKFYPVTGYRSGYGRIRRALTAAGGSVAEALPRLEAALRAVEAAGPEAGPYVVPDFLFDVAIDDPPRFLTVLLDPSGWIPAITGIQPLSNLALAPGPVTTALLNMFVTFRAGPLLVDPSRNDLPLPAQVDGDWHWVERPDPSAWSTSEKLAAPDPAAALPLSVPSLRQGWLKLAAALGPRRSGSSRPPDAPHPRRFV